MSWKIDFYAGVEEQILDMPAKIQARMIKLLELMEKHGANLALRIQSLWVMADLKYELKLRKGLGAGYFVT